MSLTPFDPYSSFVVCGATKSGKSTWVRRLLKERKHVFDGIAPTSIRYCYGTYDPSYEHLTRNDSEVSIHKGLPSKDQVLDWCKDQEHLLVVIDDLMSDVVASRDVEELFTRGCHHNKISVIFVTQNLFAQGRVARNLALNTSYLVLFKNVRDKSQVSCLGRQVFPGKTDHFLRAYEEATKPRYGYLILDLTPNCPERLRARTRTWHRQHPIVYPIVE